MLTQLFSVFDSAASRFLMPFEAETVEVAVRRFRQAVQEPGHQFNKFPEDYTLFRVGAFDQETGLLRPEATPISLGVAITFLPSGPALQEDLFEAEAVNNG